MYSSHVQSKILKVLHIFIMKIVKGNEWMAHS